MYSVFDHEGSLCVVSEFIEGATIGRYLRERKHLVMSYTKVSKVSLFPVRIYYVRKSHD